MITDYELYFGPGRHPVDALKIWQGGLGIWGAVALGALGGYLVARRRKICFPGAAGRGRAGHPGRPGHRSARQLVQPGALRPADHPALGAWRSPRSYRPAGYEQYATFHPTFLYELLWNLAAAAVLILLDRRYRLGHGKVFALYVVLYTAGRFWIEALRIDSVNEIGGFRLNNYTSLIVFVGSLIWFLWLVRNRPGRETLVEGDPPATDPLVPDPSGRAARRRPRPTPGRQTAPTSRSSPNPRRRRRRSTPLMTARNQPGNAGPA